MKPFALQIDRSQEAWSPVGEREETDFCSRDGALALKLKIEAYWRERGHDVMIALHNVGFHPAIRAARYDVRSDMINGMPRHGGARPAASTKSEDVYVEDFGGDDDIDFD